MRSGGEGDGLRVYNQLYGTIKINNNNTQSSNKPLFNMNISFLSIEYGYVLL